MTFFQFMRNVKEVKYDFKSIFDAIADLYRAIAENPDIQPIWNWITNLIAPVIIGVTIFLIGISIVCACFGQKLMGVIKFIACFVVGFALGVQLLDPIIPESVAIPAWVIGLIVALLAAVLYRFIYYLLYTLITGYGSYILFYTGFLFIKNPSHTLTRAIFCTLGAFIIVVVAFCFHKYVERAATAALGGWLVTILFIRNIYDFTALPFLKGIEWLGILFISVIIAVPCFIVQIKTRRRY